MSSNNLGLYTLTGLVIANMIGAGVFTTSGFAMGDLGSPHLVILAWGIGGCLAVCGALSYGALSRLMPESGGEYLFLSRTIHPLIGFIAGWISLLAGFTGAIAYAAMTFETYLIPASYRAVIPENVVATVAIGVAAMAHGFRLGYGTLLQNLAVLLKLVLIAAFIVIALLAFSNESWVGLQAGGAAKEFSIFTFAVTLMWISFSYSGFNAAVYLADEVTEGGSVIPKAMLIGTVTVTVVYIALNAIFVLVPDSGAIAHQKDVAAIVAGLLGGDLFTIFVRAVIAIALFTSVSAMVMAGPRVYAKMADDGLMPKILQFKGEVPTNAILMQSMLAILIVWLSHLRQLLSYLGFTLSLSAALTVASLFIAVRKTKPSGSLPGYPWAPVIFVLFTLIFVALAAVREPREMLAAVITFISGVLVYLVAKSQAR